MSKERPIPFSDPIVRAILEGRKNQMRRTRRLKKVNSDPSAYLLEQPRGDIDHSPHWPEFPYPKWHAIFWRGDDRPAIGITCPYGKPGERLWVREAWAMVGDKPDDINACYDMRVPAYYRADDVCPEHSKWRPSIYMPRWASRILLEITDIRVERLQDISADDCRAEGHPISDDQSITREAHDVAARAWYMDLWEDINGPGSWNTNPFVWKISFRRIQPCA